jgi:hypothetical protein
MVFALFFFRFRDWLSTRPVGMLRPECSGAARSTSRFMTLLSVHNKSDRIAGIEIDIGIGIENTVDTDFDSDFDPEPSPLPVAINRFRCHCFCEDSIVERPRRGMGVAFRVAVSKANRPNGSAADWPGCKAARPELDMYP